MGCARIPAHSEVKRDPGRVYGVGLCSPPQNLSYGVFYRGILGKRYAPMPTRTRRYRGERTVPGIIRDYRGNYYCRPDTLSTVQGGPVNLSPRVSCSHRQNVLVCRVCGCVTTVENALGEFLTGRF